MPVDFEIDVEDRLLIISVSGEVCAADLLAAKARVATLPGYEPDFDRLVDARRLTSLLDLSAGEVRKLAATSRAAPEARWVIVLGRNSPYHYGMSRMYQLQRTASCPESPVMICETIREALGILKRD